MDKVLLWLLLPVLLMVAAVVVYGGEWSIRIGTRQDDLKRAYGYCREHWHVPTGYTLPACDAIAKLWENSKWKAGEDEAALKPNRMAQQN